MLLEQKEKKKSKILWINYILNSTSKIQKTACRAKFTVKWEMQYIFASIYLCLQTDGEFFIRSSMFAYGKKKKDTRIC